MTPEQARKIARVLSYQGWVKYAPDDIREDVTRIAKWYEELTGQHDFTESSIMAKSEWLLEFMKSLDEGER